jgi:hypothetical protein
LAGSSDERHISVRGTDIQIGDALIVLGKRIARKKVRPPKMKTTGQSGSSKPALLPPIHKSSSTLPHHSTTQRPGPSTGPRIIKVPTEREDESYVTPAAPTVVMASPSPRSTPIVPSVTMDRPSSYTPDEVLTDADRCSPNVLYPHRSATGSTAGYGLPRAWVDSTGPRP